VTPRIVHVASGREWRGGQRQVMLLARELAHREIDQVVVTGINSELARRLISAGIEVQQAAWGPGLDPRVLPIILGELRRRPSLLHAHDAHALTLAALCSVMTGAPLVATRRVTFPLRHTLLWRRARRVIAISTAVRHALIADGLSPERLVVIPSGVDVDELQVSLTADVRTRFSLPDTGQVAVSLGALTSEKDQSTLVAAAALLVRDLPELRWIIVGEGPLRPALEQQAVRLGVDRCVHFVGQLDDAHVALAGADVFVLSSNAEGLGSAVLAAMALDVPVVASRVGGIPELIGSGGGVLVTPGNAREFATAVHRVLTDFDYGKILTRAAHRELQRFTAAGMADQVLEVYRSCVHSLDGS
jgi:L-malate glycosyltransferase